MYPHLYTKNNYILLDFKVKHLFFIIEVLDFVCKIGMEVKSSTSIHIGMV